MQNMSFSMTTEQMYSRTKTVTRRWGWWKLQAGDLVMAVEKRMGLKKGEKIKRIHPIRIRKVEAIDLIYVDASECALEGFPDMEPREFMDLLRSVQPRGVPDVVNRIEFEHLISYKCDRCGTIQHYKTGPARIDPVPGSCCNRHGFYKVDW